MSNQKQRGRRLKWLTVVTMFILCCIVVLQFYWLYTSYTQQKTRFKTDIQNALATANFKATMGKMIAYKQQELLQQQKGGTIKNDTIQIILDQPDLSITDPTQAMQQINSVIDSIKRSLANADLNIPQIQDIDSAGLQDFKKLYEDELDTRSISAPFELAFMDSDGNIIISSNKDGLKNIPLQTSKEPYGGIANSAYVQAAFLNADLYLLKSMMWILTITLTLIIIGISSLSFLLTTFFRQRKIAEIRNDFMNNMTHELKTPISSVGLALEMVLDEQKEFPEAKKKQYLRAAQNEVNRLTTLIDNVLNILSLEKSTIGINKQRIELTDFLARFKNQFTILLEHNNATLNITNKTQPIYAYADPIHLEHVLQNLLENAIKYNKQQAPLIEIKTEQNGDETLISISDNGQGIPDKYIDKVFDKFFRVPKGNVHDIKGYGLGLSYVKTIIELHGGNISVKSKENEGSTFYISLPTNNHNS